VYDADSYVVYCTEGGSEPPATGGVEFYLDDNYQDVMGYLSSLNNGTSYTLWIRAKNTSGESDYFERTTGTPVDTPPAPSVPRQPFPKSASESLSIEWNAVKGATGYELRYSKESNFNNSSTQNVAAGAGRMRGTITGLTDRVTYYVQVRATNGTGYSPSCSEAPETIKIDISKSSQVLGTALDRFPNEEAGKGDRLSRKQETALGDLVADSMLEYANKYKGQHNIPNSTIDFAFVNGGCIVGPIAKGPITVTTVRRMLHNEDNKMSIVALSGSLVKEFFRNYVAKVPHSGGGGGGTGAFGQVSANVRYTIDYNYDPRGGVMTSGPEFYDGNGWGEFVDGTVYYFVTSNYLVDSADGDGYKVLLVANNPNSGLNTGTGVSIAQAVAEYIYKLGEISPKTDGRITLLREVWQQ
jgi:hypothetical protein